MRLAAGDRVLIRLPRWLGDAVMAEPAVAALAERVGPERVTLAGPRAVVELLARGLPGSRRAPGRPAPARPAELAGSGRGEAACPVPWRGHDAAVLFTGSFRSAWDAWRSGIPVRAGWVRDGRGPLLTHGARPARELGRTPLGLGRSGRLPRVLPRPFGAACAELVGWLGVPVRRTRPRLEPTAEDRERRARRAARSGWSLAGGYVLVNAGARPGSAKGYPAGAWARVVDGLRAAGRRVVLAAGPGEEAALAELGGRPADQVLALAGPVADLGELCAWIERAELVLTADSGPRHLAVALDRPLVVVAGPTDPRHTADHLERTRLVREPVPCGPCHRERCPLGGAAHHACMRGVDPERLLRHALREPGAGGLPGGRGGATRAGPSG